MLTKTTKKRFRELAEKGYGDDVLYLDSYAWVIFRINGTHSVCVRQRGAEYDVIEVRKCI